MFFHECVDGDSEYHLYQAVLYDEPLEDDGDTDLTTLSFSFDDDALNELYCSSVRWQTYPLCKRSGVLTVAPPPSGSSGT